jgi:hypothetical protein
MKTLIAWLAMGWMLSVLQASPVDDSAVLGAWEGESKCMVPSSPCHDENVIYKVAREGKPGSLKVDAYKVVNGEQDFMGTLPCTYTAAKKNLSCHFRETDDWEFSVSGDAMDGTLVVGKERTLFRKVSLKRAR